jgi:GH15 family glucan-1,4-alpha-glucosidase
VSRAWNGKLNSFVATLDGNSMDASLLLLNEVGFLQADDPRFAATVAAVERELRHGDFIFRYVEKDDFGDPRTPS